MRDVQRSRNAQRINASVKPDEAVRKTRLDQQVYPRPRNPPPPVFERDGAPTSEALPKPQLDQGQDSRSQGNDATTVGGPPVDRAPDEFQPAPVEREAGLTVGVAPVDRSMEAVENTSLPVVERDGAPTSEALPKTQPDQGQDSRPQRDDATTVGGTPVSRATDEFQSAPVVREAGPTVGVALVKRSTDAGENTASPVIEGNGMPITRSFEALAVVMVTVVGALALIRFLFRRTYRKRVLTFDAMRRSRPIDLSLRPRQQVEADSGVASNLDSVKKALDEIDEALAEMTSSRELRMPL